MKRLNEYILEQSYNIDELILEGKFWKTVGEFLGFNTKNLGDAIKSWSNDLKQGFTTGQYLAVKSKDKNIKKAAKDEIIGAEKSPEERHNKLSEIANHFSKYDFSNYSDNDLGFVYYVYANLDLLSENLNKLNGKKIADSLKQQLEKYKVFDKAKKLYEDTYLPKVKKSGQADRLGNEKSNNEGKGNDEVKKEIKQETTETITDNKDLLTPLAKEAGVDGKTLRNFVGTQLRKTLGEDQEKIKKKGTREAVQKALGENVILGTCVMVLGALITKDDTKIQEICKQLQTTSEELKNKLQNYK